MLIVTCTSDIHIMNKNNRLSQKCTFLCRLHNPSLASRNLIKPIETTGHVCCDISMG